MRREERRVEQALVGDQPERQADRERRRADDDGARQAETQAYLPAFIAACHCLMNSRRLVWSR